MPKTESIPKKIRKRSASYPAFNLEEVISAAKDLKDKLGDGPYSRDSMAIALGYKGVTGSSGAKIAACVHFGLLDRNGNTYTQSELANQYFNYLSEKERNQILIKAFGNPTLYQKLIAEYNGKSLPQMLENILIRNYSIQENAAKGAVVNFRNSAEFVGALKNGVLRANIIDENIDNQTLTKTNDTTETMSNVAPVHSLASTSQSSVDSVSHHLSVALPSGIIVSYSQDLAPAFAFGIFGQKLMDLDKAIIDYKAISTSTSSNTEYVSDNTDENGAL